MADYIREQLIYDKTLMLGNEDNGITLLPLLYNGEVPPQMYIQLLMMVPDGKITRWEDMRGFLSSVYGIKIYTEPNARFPRIDSDGSDIPYWKIVSQNGVLIDDMRCSREMQKEKLQNAGIPVVQRGKMVGSYKVDNFKDYLFDFTLLKAIKKTDK